MTLLTNTRRFQSMVSPYNEEDANGPTYDLRIGTIIAPQNERLIDRVLRWPKQTITDLPGGEIEIRPQGIIWLVSLESLSLPDNVTAHVNLVNTLSREGLFAINTGVVDANYKGPISTAIINFSNQYRNIEIGKRFFRLSFFEHEPVSKKFNEIKRDIYVKQLERESREFPSTFLDLEGLQARIDQTTNEKIAAAVPKFLPIFVFFLALMALLASLFNFTMSTPWFKRVVEEVGKVH